MKQVYIVSITDSTGKMVSYVIIATTMTAAISAAQTKAGVTTDPQSFQKLAGPVDIEVT